MRTNLACIYLQHINDAVGKSLRKIYRGLIKLKMPLESIPFHPLGRNLIKHLEKKNQAGSNVNQALRKVYCGVIVQTEKGYRDEKKKWNHFHWYFG